MFFCDNSHYLFWTFKPNLLTDAVVSTSCISVTRSLYFQPVLLSTLSPQSSTSSCCRSRLQVRRQDGDQRQPGADHRGYQRGRCRPADSQLREDADRHHAGEGRPAGVDAVTLASSSATATPPHACSITSVFLRTSRKFVNVPCSFFFSFLLLWGVPALVKNTQMDMMFLTIRHDWCQTVLNLHLSSPPKKKYISISLSWKNEWLLR